MEILIKVIDDKAYVSLNNGEPSNISTDDLSCGTATSLTDSDKGQIQQALLKFASQCSDIDFVGTAKNLCDAVKAIKDYQ